MGKMLISLVPLLVVVLFVENAFSASKCDKTIHISKKKKSDKIEVKLPLKAPNRCMYSILGDQGCNVELTCKVDIPQNDDCEDDFLKITDGVSGEIHLCGKTEQTVMAGDGLRDLFMVLETEGKQGGVTCTATCSNGDSGRLENNKKKKVDQRCACGFQNKDDRIVGGEDAKMNEYPWLAAVVFAKTRSPNCGASVINDRYILTAAHCFWFENKKPNQIEVLIHAHSLDMTKKKGAKDVELGKEGSIRSSGYDAAKKTDKDENTQRFQVEEIINHPLFNEFYDYDYALLRLTKKIDLAAADAPTPICLPPADTWDSHMAGWKGQNFTVAGWGMSAENAGGSTRTLQKLDVPYIEWSECEKKIPADILTRRMLCAGHKGGGKDACTGDSGGPLIHQMPTKQFWQVGVVSWGEGCARKGKPGIYSRVTEATQWINFHTTEGDAKWCDGPRPSDP